MKELQNNNLRIFLQSFKYNYPYKYSVTSFYHDWKYNLLHFKKEVLENLILLNDSERAAYLKKIAFEIQELRSHSWTTRSHIQKWLEIYNTEESDLFLGQTFTPNQLHGILEDEPPSFKETFEEGFNKDTEAIQKDFYNYYYGVFLDDALDFIREQYPNQLSGSVVESPSNKLRTKLSVPQLAYFFKALVAEDFFEFKHQKDIYEFIAVAFSTKGSDSISSKSVKNNYEKPDLDAVDFLQGKFIRLAQTAKKDKERI